MLNRCLLIALAVLLTAAAPAPQRPVTIAAASDLREALPNLVSRYSQQTGVKLEVIFGSSGKLFAQIEQGAPYDAYFSANADYPRRLEAKGLTVPGTRFAYAEGRLVLWTGSGVDVSKGMAVLSDARVKKVAIANPALAPYGKAAVEALQHAGVYEGVKPKLVYGENISQTAQFATSGAAQVGIVAKSLLATPAMKAGSSWEVPASWHRPLVQEAVVLKRSRQAEAAGGFLKFVGSEEGRKRLKGYGFALPAGR